MLVYVVGMIFAINKSCGKILNENKNKISEEWCTRDTKVKVYFLDLSAM